MVFWFFIGSVNGCVSAVSILMHIGRLKVAMVASSTLFGLEKRKKEKSKTSVVIYALSVFTIWTLSFVLICVNLRYYHFSKNEEVMFKFT